MTRPTGAAIYARGTLGPHKFQSGQTLPSHSIVVTGETALDAAVPGLHTSTWNCEMPKVESHARITSFAPQFLVDDLTRSMAYYTKLGFTFGEPWGGFYAIGERDGLELHLKEAPKHAADREFRREHEHLDAAAGVDGIEAFYAQCVANGVTIFRSLAPTPWGTKDFYIEDPDGYIIAFGGRTPSPEAFPATGKQP